MTPDRQALERAMFRAYRNIDNERLPCCEDCGITPCEHSHLFPKSYANYQYIANEDNIRLQCRDCHLAWENGAIHKLKNGEMYLNFILINDQTYFYIKLFQMAEYIHKSTDKAPQWATKLMDKHADSQFR